MHGQNIVSNTSDVYYPQAGNLHQHTPAREVYSTTAGLGGLYDGVVPWVGESERNFGGVRLTNVDPGYLNRAVHSDSYEDILNDVVDSGYDVFDFGGK